MLKAWFAPNLCDFTLAVGFENWTKNISLFSYDWGVEETLQVGDYLSITYGLCLNLILNTSLTLPDLV